MRGIGDWKRACGLLGVFAAAAVLVAVVSAGRPTIPAALAVEDADHRLAGELEERRVKLMARQDGKLAVTRALVRQEISLPEAARRLRDLVGDDPQVIRWMGAAFPGVASEEELFCRHAIRLAALELDGAAHREAELTRLEAELRAYLGRIKLRPA